MPKYYWISWMFFIWTLVPSMQVIISPCKVHNFVTQPHHATTLENKQLVQIVQIPPVFIQKVLVGRCLNATSEISSNPGNHFACMQRYSAVELYVMGNSAENEIMLDQKPTLLSIMDRFKSGHFVREFVMVESGCDFNFIQVSRGLQLMHSSLHDGGPHTFHFLKSPYHTTHPQYSTASTSYIRNLAQTNSDPIHFSSVNNQPQTNSEAIHFANVNNQPQQSQFPVYTINNMTPNPVTTPYTQGGNTNNDDIRSGESSFNNHPSASPTPYNFVAPDSSASSIYQPRGSYGDDSAIDGGEKEHPLPLQSEAFHSNAETQQHTSNNNLQQVSSTKTIEPQSELLIVSDKIGVPLYILSPQVDPLLRNIEKIHS